jgi:integrase
MNRLTKSDYIDFDKCLNTGRRLINSDKQSVIGLYIIVSIHTGLRISDVLRLKWSDLMKEDLVIKEKKTKKLRTIKINSTVHSVLSKFNLKGEDDFIFKSQKGSVFSIQQINRVLKEIFRTESKHLNISSHSLRKSFGRRVYENNNESEKSLVYLSELFNHTSLSITRKYLGIRQEELNDIYLSL